MESFTISPQAFHLPNGDLRNTQLAELCSAIVPYPSTVQVRDTIQIQAELTRDLKSVWDYQHAQIQKVSVSSSWLCLLTSFSS